MSPEHISKLYEIKLANRDIVEAIKDTKHLQKNIIKYSKNQNEYIVKQYNKIRKDLTELLRNINIIATATEEEVVVLLISKMKLHIEKYDDIANETLNNLIRNKQITNEMATSLMNDSAYAYNISKRLITMAEIVYVYSDTDELMNDMALDDEELDKILNQNKG
jgi:phosphate:Na+ symporter